MSSDEQLLAEYQVNVQLWIHDDTLRQHRISNYLTLTTALLVALGVVTGMDLSHRQLATVGVAFSVFGLVVSGSWFLTLERNTDYIRFRRFQLRSIESQLPAMSTFQNTDQGLYKRAKVDFTGLNRDAFTVSRWGRWSSARVEGRLPVFICVLWVAVGVTLIVFDLSP